MRYRVFVRLKPGVLDVQGKAVENGLRNLGIENVTGVRIGKLVELDVEADSEAQSKERIGEICTKLLANTVIEDFEIQAVA